MTAIIDLLAARHAGDVFVAECKDGASWGQNGHRRLDAWTMLKTWAPLTTIGYEIKTSRSDFLRDEKWTEYLSLCHQLYFVCPRKLIEPQELPEQVGLIWAGKSLVTRRKAVRREIELPARLMAYVLMSRTRIVRDMHEANTADRQASWRAWLADKRDSRTLGQLVAGRIGHEYRRMVGEVHQAQQQAQMYQSIRQRIIELGYDPELPAGDWPVRRRLDELTKDRVVEKLRRAADECSHAIEAIESDGRNTCRDQ